MLAKRNREIWFLIIGILVIGSLIPIVDHYKLRSETNHYISWLKSKGEPMDLAQVIPQSVPAPEGQNGADDLIEAFNLIDADQGLFATNFYGIEMMKGIAPGKALICWRQPDDKEFDATNSWSDLAAAVSQNQMSFDLLRQSIGKQKADFKIQYDRGVADLNYKTLYLSESKSASQRLSAALMCDLHSGDTASAVENLRAMLSIANALKDQRLIISELVQIAIAQISDAATWEVLQSPHLTDGELAQLQHDWSNLDFDQSAENALAMERVTGEISVRKWRASNSELEGALQNDDLRDYLTTVPKVILWRGWLSYPDELRSLQGYQVMIEAMRLEQTNHSFLAAIQYQNEKLDGLTITNSNESDYYWLLTSEMSSTEDFIKPVMKAETAKQIVMTAISLKRYQLKHGTYPKTLNALVPEFVPSVPLDPADGKPLRYRSNTDGTFLLYSVGPNGHDDGGNPALEPGAKSRGYYWLDPHTLDWVWPMPVTNSETQPSSSPL